MTDDLSKYEEIAKEIQMAWSGPHPWWVAIEELIAMVRHERALHNTTKFHSEERGGELYEFLHAVTAKEAALRIAAEAEATNLRELLKPFAATSISNGASDEETVEVLIAHIRRARAALGKE